ncbi:MAG: iron-containing redox enzyme family protein [Gammaproteobacteria bacterium]|nr:iron-containing redox enzyme family protein [Gammaproteobacteria bacterium]
MQHKLNISTQESDVSSVYDRLIAETEASRKEFLAVPILQKALQGNVSREQYVSFLGQAYHHVRHTVPLLMGCGYRLPDRLNWLRTALGAYIEEEVGHEEWILNDIHACGGAAEVARAAVPFAATELMVAYAYDTIQRRNPIGLFGMIFVLESTSAALATTAAGAIQGSLNLPETAFRYLTSHGSLDQEHIQFFQALVNRFDDPADVDALLHCAKMFYRLYGDVFRSIS